MDYKNFSARLLFSLLFFFIYLLILYINFQFVFYVIILIYFLIFLEIYLNFTKYKIIPIFYLLISFIFFYNINFNNQIILFFNLFIVSIVSFDIFSYLVGNIFGKNQLTKISPNKTIEGLLGGLIFSILISLLFSIYFKLNINLNIITFIILLILSAFIGDIIESYYKRKNNLKNSSEFVPGHGGVFDRFDSFLFAIIFFSISINYLV
tara:strand:+ start:709 stop:1332 length:624 start_codon:yes stop_codon:yes gene_type:complete